MLERLAAFRPRSKLRESPLFAAEAEEIRRLTFAVELGSTAHSQPAERNGRPAFLRAVSWNIERGRRFEGILEVLKGHPLLRQADLLLLTEVDVGMARSGNRHVPRELAHALGMHYAFGNSYLCLSPGNPRDGRCTQPNSVGLHGNAVLSRWPIRAAESCSVAITKDKLTSSEPRLGHKKALGVHISTPLGPLGALVVHLDSGSGPQQRGAQMRDALGLLRRADPGLPWLVGGDFNTTTYDARGPWQLARCLATKFWRGGFPHALEHYLHPQRLYEREVFAALEAERLRTEGFNAEGVGTLRYEVGDWQSESKLYDYMPRFAARYLERKLRPYGGAAAFKLDWFAARGLRGLRADERRDAPPSCGQRASVAPAALQRLHPAPLSDHDPIFVDVAPA